MIHFSQHKTALQQRLNSSIEKFDPKNYRWVIKGDISGIQEFIFSVKSEKASKSLKGRSFFVQALSLLGIELLQNHLGRENMEVFYNGGGNFFLLSKVPPSDAVSEVRTVIDLQCKEEEIYLAFSIYSIKDNDHFADVWRAVNYQSNIDKLRKFQEDVFAFEPYEHKIWKNKKWEDANGFEFDEISKTLREVKVQPLHIDIQSSNRDKRVNKSGVYFFDYHLSIGGLISMNDYVIGLPKWDERLRKEYDTIIQRRKEFAPIDGPPETENNNIIDFSFLADFANHRTGTDKIGILKLDVDNLGKVFESIEDWGTAKKTSSSLSWFFGEYINLLLNEPFDNGKFSDNMYVVFSGGDDTFIVGAWDAIFEFSNFLQANFKAFSAEIKSFIGQELTFSASITVVGAKFPVIRFAENAEEALSIAKKWEDGNGKVYKNRIYVFGQILSWEEWDAAKMLAITLNEMIRKGETSRSIIERIKKVAMQYESLAERAAEGRIPGPKVYRLFYTMRKWASNKKTSEDTKNSRVEFFEKEIQQFSTALLEAFITKKKAKYPKYPVAARWAEFMTRNAKTFTKQNIQ